METPDYFKVERDEAGCEHCDHGGSWTVTWGEGDEAQQIDTSFDDKECAEDAQRWMQGAFELGRDLGWIEHCKRVHPPAVAIAGLPIPRLQLTWHQINSGEFLVTYDLVVPAERGDIRDTERLGYICRPMSGGTKIGTGSPFRTGNQLDTPYRDGAHIHMDALRLRLPAYVVYGGHHRQLWEVP
jgi:hypothetical protein